MFFSIVIANYNGGRYLEEAIQSLLAQSCQDFELLIVDGGSSDESLDIINKYKDRLAWWCSEPDSGQSEAFNKGFSRSQGEFLTWLNADDVLLPDTLAAVKRKLLKHPKAAWGTGNFLRFLQSDGTIIEMARGPHYLPGFLQGVNAPIVVFGPTAFIRRSTYQNAGPFDEAMHYGMDTEYWQRLKLLGFRQVRINHCCWGFRMHAGSKTAEFESHTVGNEVKEKIRLESQYWINKNHFSPSKLLHHLLTLCRLFDGSWLIALRYRMVFSNNKKLQELYPGVAVKLDEIN